DAHGRRSAATTSARAGAARSTRRVAWHTDRNTRVCSAVLSAGRVWAVVGPFWSRGNREGALSPCKTPAGSLMDGSQNSNLVWAPTSGEAGLALFVILPRAGGAGYFPVQTSALERRSPLMSEPVKVTLPDLEEARTLDWQSSIQRTRELLRDLVESFALPA